MGSHSVLMSDRAVRRAHLAISDSTAALAYAPRSVKALYRRSTALQTVGRADLAKIGESY